MATLSALHPYVVPHFPNVPEPAIDRAILDGAIQFCRDSLVWQESTNPIQAIAGVAEYDVEPVSNAEPIRVLAAVKAHAHLDSFDLHHAQTVHTTVSQQRSAVSNKKFRTTLTLKCRNHDLLAGLV